MTTQRGTAPPVDHAHGEVDWWHWADLLVWASVVVIATIVLEWAAGKMLRERIAGQAQRYLARVRDTGAETTP